LVSHIILLLFNSSSLISCRLIALCACHCVLSFGWFESLLHNCTITEHQGDLQATGNSTTFFSRSSKKYCPTRLLSQHPKECQGDVLFFNHSTLRKNQYQCTYEDPISTVPEQPPMFFLQKTNSVNSIPMSRTAYNESSQVGPLRAEEL
jgi:hypothetical protein